MDEPFVSQVLVDHAWHVRVPIGPEPDAPTRLIGVALGRTKSEARAAAKLLMPRRRLPPGTFLYRVS